MYAFRIPSQSGKKLREEIHAMRREMRALAVAPFDAGRCKRNLQGGSSLDNAGEEYHRGGYFCGYHGEPGKYNDLYGAYGQS